MNIFIPTIYNKFPCIFILARLASTKRKNIQIDKTNAAFQNDLPLFIKKVKQDKNKQRPAKSAPIIILGKLIPFIRKTPIIGKIKVNVFFIVIYLK